MQYCSCSRRAYDCTQTGVNFALPLLGDFAKQKVFLHSRAATTSIILGSLLVFSRPPSPWPVLESHRLRFFIVHNKSPEVILKTVANPVLRCSLSKRKSPKLSHLHQARLHQNSKFHSQKCTNSADRDEILKLRNHHHRGRCTNTGAANMCEHPERPPEQPKTSHRRQQQKQTELEIWRDGSDTGRENTWRSHERNNCARYLDHEVTETSRACNLVLSIF